MTSELEEYQTLIFRKDIMFVLDAILQLSILSAYANSRGASDTEVISKLERKAIGVSQQPKYAHPDYPRRKEP